MVDYIKCGLTAIPVSELEDVLNTEDYFTPQGDTGISVIEEEWQVSVTHVAFEEWQVSVTHVAFELCQLLKRNGRLVSLMLLLSYV